MCSSVEAERDGETLKMRVQSIEALEAAAANVQRGLKLVLDRRARTSGDGSATRRAEQAAQGRRQGRDQARRAAAGRGQEVEFTLPGRYEIGPMQMGELSTLPGVLEVLEI